MTELVRNGGEEIDTCAKAKAEIMIEVAGALGEHLFTGGKLLVHKGDMCRARNIAKWHRGDEASTWIDELRCRTRNDLGIEFFMEDVPVAEWEHGETLVGDEMLGLW